MNSTALLALGALAVVLASACSGGLALQAPQGEPLSLTLATGPCLGTCPVYALEIRDRTLTYTGMSDVLWKGTHRRRISDRQIAELLRLLEEVQYFDLHDILPAGGVTCPSYRTDHPEFKMQVITARATNEVRVDTGCYPLPKVVDTLPTRVLEIAGVRGLVF